MLLILYGRGMFMEIFDVLKNEKPVFVLDDIEDKKTKALITQINGQLSNILSKLEEFKSFANSQLEGDYHKKIVMVKSLQRVYGNWITMNNACANIVREEANAVNSFNAARDQIINNLNLLLKESAKFPVVSAYDVFGTDFVFAKKGHSVIILGNNNTFIIETIINELNKKMDVSGNFNDVEPIELTANYSDVEKNVADCKRAIDELYYGKTSKEDKLLSLVSTMEEVARDLVFFETYKKEILNVGCVAKEVELRQKELMKKYIPLKKQLCKLLKVELIDICDLKAYESEFATQEFKAIDEETFGE